MTALGHYRECIQRQVPMLLSTIVVSEFQVKQAINDLPLRKSSCCPSTSTMPWPVAC